MTPDKDSPVNGLAADTHLTMTTFWAYKKTDLKPAIKEARKNARNSFSSYYANRLLRWKRRCEVFKATDTLSFYQSLSDNIGIFVKKDAQQVQTRISKAIEGSDKTLSEKFTAAFAALKTAKDKLKAVRNNGEELANNFKDSSFNTDVSKLSETFKDGTPSKADNQDNLQKTIEDLKEKSKSCFDLADDSVEIAVKVAGIHASANVSSLKTLGDKLVENVNALQTDLETNIKTTQGNLLGAQKTYNATVEKLVESKYVQFADSLRLAGLFSTLRQVNEPDCKEWSHDTIVKKLDAYVKQIEDNFDDIAETQAKVQAKAKVETPPQ
jgi:hypothetical protein